MITMRELELVRAEIRDCGIEMANCMRAQAEILKQRADTIENIYTTHPVEKLEEETDKMDGHSFGESLEMESMRHHELSTKMHRLSREFYLIVRAAK